MKKLGLAFLMLIAMSVAAQQRPDAQIAAMKKLDYMTGVWRGEGWTAHTGDVGALTIVFLICTAISAKAFRWE